MRHVEVDLEENAVELKSPRYTRVATAVQLATGGRPSF